MPRPLPKLWIITDPAHEEGPVAPLERALAGCPAGGVGVQLRAPHSPDRHLVAWGRALREVTRACGALLTVNRRADVAAIVEADGVHLPERGLDPAHVRAGFGECSIIGVSRHDAEGLEEADRGGATFAFLSPVFPVPGKGEPIGIEGFEAAIAGVELPTYALGGVDVSSARALVAAGAHGIAVRRAIYRAHEPKAALCALLDALDNEAANGE